MSCLNSGRDCGPRLLPKNDRYRRDAISKRRIMQRILFLLQVGVDEVTIMGALNSIPVPGSQQPDAVAHVSMEESILFPSHDLSFEWNEPSFLIDPTYHTPLS